MAKNLLLFCDGTWDSADQAKDPQTGEICVSNVLKMAVRMKKVTAAGKLQVVYYDQGVGTGNALDKAAGGAFGAGLDMNVNDVYRFLIANYEPGDGVYLFGFSRGAYTARCIGGMIRRCGILKRTCVRSYPDAKDLYRSGVSADDPKAKQFRKDFAIEDDTPIQCVAVWDTVGALGIPVVGFDKFDEKKYGFLDTSLGASIKFAFHALAVDEHRGPFKPTLWDSQPGANQTVQQVWFAGAHSDVGGGYEEHGLSDLALNWLMERAEEAGAERDQDVIDALGTKESFGQAVHDSAKGFFTIGKIDRQVGATKFKTEYFHRSLIQKWADKNENYCPNSLKPLAARLDALAAGALNDEIYPV